MFRDVLFDLSDTNHPQYVVVTVLGPVQVTASEMWSLVKQVRNSFFCVKNRRGAQFTCVSHKAESYVITICLSVDSMQAWMPVHIVLGLHAP
jgi:hypothetical protein